VTGITGLIGPESIYTGDERVGATLKRAYAEATAWIERDRPAREADTARPGRYHRKTNSQLIRAGGKPPPESKPCRLSNTSSTLTS